MKFEKRDGDRVEYTIIEKAEYDLLERTSLGGTDGQLFLAPNHDRILKLLYNFALYQGIDGKKRLLNDLLQKPEMKEFSAIPEELVYVPHKNKFGYWMNYYETGVNFDEWCKGKDYETVLKMFNRISEILKLFHEKYGIVVTDCYYTNILIVDNQFPIFVDVDSFSMEGVISYTTSNILYHYSKKQYWNRYQQGLYLSESKDADNAALWLMFLETALSLPVRKNFLRRFSSYLKRREDITPIIKEIACLISVPELENVPYLHEVSKVYQLK